MPQVESDNGHHERLGEPIAIVGMSCTLAGSVNTPSDLWQTLLNKEIKQSAKVPESRFNIDAYYHENAFGRPAAIGSRGGFFLDTDLHAFDASFFGLDADEAQHMDPQHFRALESVYECLESAGRTLDDVRGTNTAVYIGNFSLDQVIKSARNSYDDRHLHEVIGVDPGLMSSRVSYCYDLNGPVFSTNTGCTSSLFALHTAAMALRGGECSSAIVGGVNLLQGPEAYSSYSKFGIMSPDSMCHSFDARCNGYCRAEGAGTLYVRLLSDAIRDGDPIRGVIRSIAVNANGFVPNMPLFVPNQMGLEKSMELAYTQADLDPKDTAFVETHGIGMVLGEIAEAHAVGKFMNQPMKRESPVLVGSLKPNFGHQEAASGVFVLIKAAMMTEAGIIPGHADFQTPHPMIDLDALNVKVQTETVPWPDNFPGRRVALCSYGWSGTNAHVIVEDVHSLHPKYTIGQYRERAKYDHSIARPLLITFSAKNETSLTKNINSHASVAAQYYMSDLAYTLNIRRSRFEHRAFAIASDADSAQAFVPSAVKRGCVPADKGPPKVAFAFADASTVARQLALELFQTFPVFKQTIQKLDAVLERSGNAALVEDYIQGSAASSSLPNGTLALLRGTVIQIALTDLLANWNIRLDLAISQKGGEIAAGYAAGRLSAIDAVLLPLCREHDYAAIVKTSESGSDALRELRQKVGSDSSASQTEMKPMVFDDDTGSTQQLVADCEVVVLIGQYHTRLDGSGSDIDARLYTLSDLRHCLETAGELYLQGYPVDLETVNSLGDIDWKPLLLVDLPPYQWDHSKRYTAETYANHEHRVNKYPYHDLLGRRVFGLSPQTMVWKNKLSFRDLPTSIPWIPNEKPMTVVGPADLLSIAAEALGQAFESEVRKGSTRIVDLTFLHSLRYAEDCDLIELQTSISKLPGAVAGGKTSFRFGVESIKEQVWTTHCEGTIIIDLAATQNPPAAANDVSSHAHRTITFSPQSKLPENLLCGYQLHPALIEVCLQAVAESTERNITAISTVIVNGSQSSAPGDWVIHVTDSGQADMLNGSGQVILSLGGVQSQETTET